MGSRLTRGYHKECRDIVLSQRDIIGMQSRRIRDFSETFASQDVMGGIV